MIWLFLFFGGFGALDSSAVLAADSALAKTSAFPPARFPASKVKAVRVTGADWRVNFQARPPNRKSAGQGQGGDSYLFEIKTGGGSLDSIESFLSADGTVIVQDNRPAQRLRKESAAGEKPEKKAPQPAVLKVTGPGEAAISLFLLRGKARIIGWKGPVFIFSAENTELEGEKNQGAWRLNLRQGRVNLQKHKGDLDLQGFHLRTVLKNQQGSVRLQFNEGRLQVSESEGDLSWTTDRGEADLRDWRGGLKGESVSGKISGNRLRPGTARLVSKKGAVALRFASRPLLDIKSASGTIRAPRYMNKKRAGKALSVAGRLRGAGPREGEVFIETESGAVFVR